MLNTDSRKRSAVGRISCDEGEARLRPFNRPPTMRIVQLLVLGLQIALAVIAAPGSARRSVAVGLVLVARAGLLAAGALHQHAAALAVGDQRAFSRRLERLLAARRSSVASIEPYLTPSTSTPFFSSSSCACVTSPWARTR